MRLLPSGAGLAVAVLLLAAQPALAKSVALVIGIDRYPALSSLARAAADARAVGAKLQALGYRVVDAIDVDRKGFEAALRDAAATLKAGDKAVVFFAGHGTSVGGRQFLILSDFPGKDAAPADLARAMIGLDGIVQALRAAGASSVALIVDTNRNPGFAGKEADLLKHLPGETSDVSGTFILFSTEKDGTVFDALGTDDRDPNSVFTRHLLSALADGGKTWTELFQDVAERTDAAARAAGLEQTPSFIDNLSAPLAIGATETEGSGSPVTQGGNRARSDGARQ